MRVLICCEFSGVVRDAFAARGHDAWSCDLLPTESQGQHIQGDLREALKQYWDFIGFHTDCTYMTNSGVRWLKTRPERWPLLREACELFNLCLRDPRPGYLENPVPHKYAVGLLDRNYDQTIQPHMFGHLEVKRTCLWLKNIRPLIMTQDVKKQTFALPYKDRAKVHYASPGPNRWKVRSRTMTGIGKAMAKQWG